MSNYFTQSFIMDEYGKKVIKKRYACKSIHEAKKQCNYLKNEHRHSFKTSIEIICIHDGFTAVINYAPIYTGEDFMVKDYTRTVATIET